MNDYSALADKKSIVVGAGNPEGGRPPADLDTVADLLSPVDESSGRLLRAYPLLSIVRGAATLVWRDAWALVKAHRAGVIFAVTLLAAVSAAHILGRVGAA